MSEKKILIVEDETDVARVLVKRLEAAGYQTVVAVDAMQAVQAAHHEKPDLVILDVMLPAGGGESVLLKLKMSMHLRTMPVVVLTGTQEDGLKEKMLGLGADEFFLKPYESVELLKCIERLLIGT